MNGNASKMMREDDGLAFRVEVSMDEWVGNHVANCVAKRNEMQRRS